MNLFKKITLIYILFWVIFGAYQINTEISYLYNGTYWLSEILFFLIIPTYLGYLIGKGE